ncbi:MAG TPA: hypothetical protein DCZ92_14835 [Elusimicrobia bacterium]|nr:MAG: hypothetical protein A2016_10855 [Elusimicrobia bacterium GWF2_62_30]HBA62058.1 hypothetical protein [Elusimicrobiota bacterium]
MAAGGAAYAATGSPAMSVSCLLSGVLLDVDHLLDFYLTTDEPFSYKVFRAWCHEVRWERIYLVLHSYELYLLLVLAAFVYRNEVLTGAALGMGLHLLMDQLGNTVLDKRFYFFIFRYRSGFAKSALLAGGKVKEAGK